MTGFFSLRQFSAASTGAGWGYEVGAASSRSAGEWETDFSSVCGFLILWTARESRSSRNSSTPDFCS